MANKTDVLNELTVAQLKELAEENDASDELSGVSAKSDIVEALQASSKVTKAKAQAKLDESQPIDDEEGDEEEPVTVSPEDVGSGQLPTNAGNTGNAASPTTDVSGEDNVSEGGPTPTTPSNTLATTPLSSAARGPEAVLDPALADPEGTARQRVEGRTSDAANRDAGVTADEVPPDLNAGPKQSDAGPELYPFPPGGDVDVATVNASSSEDEKLQPLAADDWVVLDGTHELVPDRLDGHIAYVVDAPTILCNCDWAPRTHEHPHPEAAITVRTRDEANATLYVPVEAFKFVGRGGRSAVMPTG